MLHDAALDRTGIEAQAIHEGTSIHLVELAETSLPAGRRGHAYETVIPRNGSTVEVSIRHYSSYVTSEIYTTASRFRLAVAEGTPSPVLVPVVWSVAGRMPRGLTLTQGPAARGRVSGIPTRLGTRRFTIRLLAPGADGSVGLTGSATPITIEVNP
jgi:hypothetical protein